MADVVSRERVQGMVLGAAVGDALGFPVEFLSPEQIVAQYGPDGITCLPTETLALYSDDTQMAEIVLRVLMRARQERWDLEATMNELGRGFASWAEAPQGGHRFPGRACLAGARAFAAGASWRTAGAPDAGGCGSVMRVYPFGLLFQDEPDRAVAWAVEHSRLTHGAPLALAACAGMTAGVLGVLADATPAQVVREIASAAAAWDDVTGDMVKKAADDALNGTSPVAVLDVLRGWAAHEALAAAVFVFLRHPDDYRAAAREAANTPGDSDSIATLVGALVGARLGIHGLPGDWLPHLERATDLMSLADQAWAIRLQETGRPG